MGLSSTDAIVEMQFADFVSTGFNPLWTYWLSHIIVGWNADGGMPCGGGTQAGPFIPRPMKLGLLKHLLKVVYPAFPYDAKDY
jgi:2-oxoisovalerate dehydrogenase E1 component